MCGVVCGHGMVWNGVVCTTGGTLNDTWSRCWTSSTAPKARTPRLCTPRRWTRRYGCSCCPTPALYKPSMPPTPTPRLSHLLHRHHTIHSTRVARCTGPVRRDTCGVGLPARQPAVRELRAAEPHLLRVPRLCAAAQLARLRPGSRLHAARRFGRRASQGSLDSGCGSSPAQCTPKSTPDCAPDCALTCVRACVAGRTCCLACGGSVSTATASRRFASLLLRNRKATACGTTWNLCACRALHVASSSSSLYPRAWEWPLTWDPRPCCAIIWHGRHGASTQAQQLEVLRPLAQAQLDRCERASRRPCCHVPTVPTMPRLSRRRYDTSIADDEALLAGDGAAAGGVGSRQWNAIRFRLSEKRLLAAIAR